MSKTVTMRIDEGTYELFKAAASAEKRTLSNFIEFAALSHMTEESFVSNTEMESILKDASLLKKIRQARMDVRKGRYTVVG